MAKTRRKKVTIVHKANVLTVSDGLFKNVAREVAARDYPDVTINDMYIDSAVMDLVRRPPGLRRNSHDKPIRRHTE